jgi:paired amphipathic helix protein Sin3a
VGFNTFLPPGYRIRPDCTVDVNPLEMEGGNKSERTQPSYPPPPPGSIPRQAIAPAPPKPQKPKPKAPRASNSSHVEFDHAIHYVTTIKQRFANEPETYKAFLEILHTYQKEQRSIRQVLDQVSFLFRDHPDLLREFTFFLPDAVQDQAKKRLHYAAEKAQMRKDRGTSSSFAGVGKGPEGKQGYGLKGESPKSGGQRPRQIRGRPEDDEGDYYKERGPDEYGNRLISPRDEPIDPRREKERERTRNKALFAHKRAKRRSYDGKERRDFLAVSDAVVETEEWAIFEKIKKILPSRDNWREFLKCLELYSQEVLGREEMLSLMRNLFGRHTDLVEEFDRLLCSHGQQKTSKCITIVISYSSMLISLQVGNKCV